MFKFLKKPNFAKQTFLKFDSLFSKDNFMQNFEAEVDKIHTTDATEFFDHYDVYGYWLARKLQNMGNKKEILDLGSKKVVNAMNSVYNSVTSLILKDPQDPVSAVNYVIWDAGSNELPFGDNTFDVFTSAVSLHTMGLGRYGDKLNPNALIDFISELNRVMKKKSDLIFTLTYGHDFLKFNQGWIFSMNSICKLFNGWELQEYFIDNSSAPISFEYNQRLATRLENPIGPKANHRTIFLHFNR